MMVADGLLQHLFGTKPSATILLTVRPSQGHFNVMSSDMNKKNPMIYQKHIGNEPSMNRIFKND